MSSPADVEKYLNDPELAISHLPELFAFLGDSEPEVADYAVEALENCGAPPRGSIGFLCQECGSDNALISYWACTLLGRAIENGDGTEQVLATLHGVIKNQDVDLATREKAVLAFTFAPQLDSESREILESLLPGAAPRMTRLIESALNKTITH